MKIEILPDSLLNGKCLHCKPVVDGPTVEAMIVRSDEKLTPAFIWAILCPQRRPKSKCGLRDRPGVRGPRYCLWFKGDSLGVYQIIGPGMDKKSGV